MKKTNFKIVLTLLVLMAGGTAVAASGPQLTFTPVTWNFGNVVLNDTGTFVFQMTNTGTQVATLSNAALTGTGFTYAVSFPTSGCATVQVGAWCDLMVQFKPTTTGLKQGTLTITYNTTYTVQAAFQGTGVSSGPELTFNPFTWNLGNVLLGQPELILFHITNTGNQTSTLLNATSSGAPYTWWVSYSNNGNGSCTPLAPGQWCDITMEFSPTALGPARGTVTVTGNGPTVVLTTEGTGTNTGPELSANPITGYNFGDVVLNTPTHQVYVITNVGTQTATVTGYLGSGAPYSYQVTEGNCNSLAPQGTCQITETFDPTQVGPTPGSLVLSTSTQNLVISFEGTGVAVGAGELNPVPSSLNFMAAPYENEQQGTDLMVTGNSVIVSQISITGCPYYTWSAPQLPWTIPAGQSPPVTVTFAPTTTGTCNGTMTIVSNASNSPATVALSGTAAPYTELSWTGSQGATSYNMFRNQTGSPPWTQINTSPITGTSYTDTTVACGQNYWYCATAVNSYGQSVCSSPPVEASFTTQCGAMHLQMGQTPVASSH